GSLAGLIAYRHEALDTVQNNLGRLAVGLADSINKVHATGVDLTGAGGAPFFSMGAVRIMPSGTAAVAATITDVNKLTGSDYHVSRNEANDGYVISSVPAGTSQTVPDDAADPTKTVAFEGVSFTLPSDPLPVATDYWQVQPTRYAAGQLSLAITDPAKIAAAGAGLGSANGDVALELAKVQTNKVLGGGAMSLNEAFSQIVNKVGVLTQQNSTEAKAQSTLIQQNFAAQQAVSG